MEQSKIAQQQELNALLNQYRHEYYNLNAPTVSDEVYDRLFDKLRELEQTTGVQMANSPTQTVGWPAVSKLEKTIHIVPLFSLDPIRIRLFQCFHRYHCIREKIGSLPEPIPRLGCASHKAHPAYTEKGFEYNDHDNSSAQFFGTGASLVYHTALGTRRRCAAHSAGS